MFLFVIFVPKRAPRETATIGSVQSDHRYFPAALLGRSRERRGRKFNADGWRFNRKRNRQSGRDFGGRLTHGSIACQRCEQQKTPTIQTGFMALFLFKTNLEPRLRVGKNFTWG